jgi:hypothetical protein
MKMKKINWKGNIIALGICGAVFGGAVYINHINDNSFDPSYITAKADISNQNNLSVSSIGTENNDVTDQLEVSNVTTFTANTLNDIRGTITNTGNNDINDVYGEMAIYDENGNLIRVKEMHIDSLKAGQSMAFDELVGQYTHAASVKLQQFTE